MGCLPIPRDLLEKWESHLESEGLGVMQGTREALFTRPQTLERCFTEQDVEGKIWSAPVDLVEQEQADALMAWLPHEDQQVIRWSLDGVYQVVQGKRLGITQSSVSDRHKAAMARLKALAAARDDLPRDREHLFDLVRDHWAHKISAGRPPAVIARFFLAYAEVWSGRAAAELAGIPEGTGTAWRRRLLRGTTPELAPVRGLVGVIRGLQTQGRG